MSEHRVLRIDDYIAFLRRRWWMILVPAVLGTAIGYGTAQFIPPRYTSKTMVLVEQPRVSATLVTPVVTEELNQRLGTMKEQIMSRTRLQPIVEKFNLYPDQPAMESRIDALRGAVEVTAVQANFGGGGRGAGVPGFTISFTSADPQLAQQVCSDITSMFISENLRLREQRSQGTTDFLTKQLDESKRQLDEQDSRLAEFKRRHIGQLPGSEQTNLNMLGTLTAQLEATTQALNRAQQDKNYLETMLQQRLSALESLSGGSIANPQILEKQLQAAQAKLMDLETRYTAGHPDVIKARREVAQLQARSEEVAAESEKPRDSRPRVLEPPDVQELRTQLHNLEQTIKQRTAQQQALQRDIGTYQARVQGSPLVEEQYKQFTRDYETALRFYNELLAKRTQSEMATDLERQQQGEQFRVVDPPNLPEKPSFPDETKFAGGGLAGGLALGLGIALFLDFRSRTIHTDTDVEFYLGVPTLAMITDLNAAKQPRKLLPGRRASSGTNGAARTSEKSRETVSR